MDRLFDFFEGAKGYPSTPGGGCKGAAPLAYPCIETFVFDELKVNNFRPFFSLNFLKIRLQITKNKG